jgi:hypothetical protein
MVVISLYFKNQVSKDKVGSQFITIYDSLLMKRFIHFRALNVVTLASIVMEIMNMIIKILSCVLQNYAQPCRIE